MITTIYIIQLLIPTKTLTINKFNTLKKDLYYIKNTLIFILKNHKMSL